MTDIRYGTVAALPDAPAEGDSLAMTLTVADDSMFNIVGDTFQLITGLFDDGKIFVPLKQAAWGSLILSGVSFIAGNSWARSRAEKGIEPMWAAGPIRLG